MTTRCRSVRAVVGELGCEVLVALLECASLSVCVCVSAFLREQMRVREKRQALIEPVSGSMLQRENHNSCAGDARNQEKIYKK